jgi:regulator of replication initiation timing
MEKNQIPNEISQVIDEVNDISALRANVEVFSELTQLRAENERLKKAFNELLVKYDPLYTEDIRKRWLRKAGLITNP